MKVDINAYGLLNTICLYFTEPSSTIGMDGCTEEMDVLGEHLHWW